VPELLHIILTYKLPEIDAYVFTYAIECCWYKKRENV